MPETERGRKGRRTVCIISPHPLVLQELGKALSDERFLVKPHQVAGSPLDELPDVPRAWLFVVDTHLFLRAETVVASIVDRSEESARIVALAQRYEDRDAFSLLRLGVKGFVLYEDVAQALPLALDAVGAGGFWAPRALLSRFMDEIVTGSRGRRRATRSAALSGRERTVLKALLQNLSNKEIADRLHISERTAKFHVSNLLAKFGVRRRQDLIVHCLESSAGGDPTL